MLTSVKDLGIQFHTEINGRPSGLEHSPADGSGQSIRLDNFFAVLIFFVISRKWLRRSKVGFTPLQLLIRKFSHLKLLNASLNCDSLRRKIAIPQDKSR